ncbi:MAG: valine--tRNA ligase, partial [DPANN group archaeon]|nr:valine--tRNA ligase [DPANN group archaeon]
MALAPKPDFKVIESKWQKFWLDNKIYKFDPKSKKNVFSIDTPPPYISGNPHMGHGVSYTGFEFIARYKRMKGFNVFFPIGFDDNGHPTERYVEKKHNIRSTDVPRQKFIELCRQETEILEKTAKESFVRLGHSYDWDLFYSTISDKAIKTAQLSFLDLYKKKLAYRTEEPGLWCVECQTALSQADVEDEERETKLNFIDFKLENSGTLQIATTRPELLPACVGIFVHPEDARYKKFIGKNAVVPLFHHVVPIIADKKVDPNFGTGAVMICTFGDKTDVEWWRTHGLALRIVLEKNGRLGHDAHEFAGTKIKEAREKIIDKLKETEHLVKQEPLKQNVGVCWRCHKPVELIITKQWAIKAIEAKKELLDASQKLNWVPQYHSKRFEDWVKNLNTDWVISRQRHYGVPIPVWYCKACDSELVAGESELPVDPNTKLPAKSKCKCGSAEWRPDADVFDTWMTSSLTPQINRGFSKESIPFDMRPQGYDIIRTWAFYTILKSLYHFKKIPWKNAMVNGMVLDPKGKAMHKSLGNVIDPMAQVDKYGSDAFRYFASTVNIGEDAPFQEKEIVHGQKLLIKLWNVARFAEPHLSKASKSTNIIDKWILSRLSEIIKIYEKNFDNYDAVPARRELEQFFWHELCDFYLEMIKPRIYGSDEKAKA